MANPHPLADSNETAAAAPSAEEHAGLLADRRAFLASMGLVTGAAMAPSAAVAALTQGGALVDAQTQTQAQPQTPDPAQEDAAEITIETIAEAQKLLGLEFTQEERELMLERIKRSVRGYQGYRASGLGNGEAPAERFDPLLPGSVRRHAAAPHVAPVSLPPAPPIPERDEDIAFAPVSHLAGWLRTRRITSERLTKIYLDRLKTYGPKLLCVITITEDLALEQARSADREIRAGRWRGPLHGVPYGLKDLFDTRGVKTTWGAAPYKDRVPSADATVVKKLTEAGAVLCAKLTMGALAQGDVWFGGRTRNPFNTEQGSSGSSAGSASAAAAGLVGFTLGTETYGSIISPSSRCGATGLRPTFGRVSRVGAMALCWSLDKIGPICRTALDTALVLEVINGQDLADGSSIATTFGTDAIFKSLSRHLRVGYTPSLYEGRSATDDDRRTLDIIRDLGHELVEVEVPRGAYGQVIGTIINVESACAFDELTRSNEDDLMRSQGGGAWPNTFRTARFTPAVEFLMAQRLRRRFMAVADELFANIDVMTTPSRGGSMQPLTNLTGHPAIAIRHGFRENGTPRSFTLFGTLFGEAYLLALAHQMEQKLGLWDRRPELSA